MLPLLLLLFVFVFIPLLWLDTLQAALLKLNLNPVIASIAVLGMIAGSAVNIPLYRIHKTVEQPTFSYSWFSQWHMHLFRSTHETVIAVNLGGCVIPVLIAAYQILRICRGGGWPITVLIITTAVSTAVCYYQSFPIAGVGIAMPAMVPAFVSILLTWLLIPTGSSLVMRAPIAFTAGVLGPLIGADLFRLKQVTSIAVGVASIGGAGTFDGIVLSGIFAALLT